MSPDVVPGIDFVVRVLAGVKTQKEYAEDAAIRKRLSEDAIAAPSYISAQVTRAEARRVDSLILDQKMAIDHMKHGATRALMSFRWSRNVAMVARNGITMAHGRPVAVRRQPMEQRKPVQWSVFVTSMRLRLLGRRTPVRVPVDARGTAVPSTTEHVVTIPSFRHPRCADLVQVHTDTLICGTGVVYEHAPTCIGRIHVDRTGRPCDTDEYTVTPLFNPTGSDDVISRSLGYTERTEIFQRDFSDFDALMWVAMVCIRADTDEEEIVRVTFPSNEAAVARVDEMDGLVHVMRVAILQFVSLFIPGCGYDRDRLPSPVTCAALDVSERGITGQTGFINNAHCFRFRLAPLPEDVVPGGVVSVSHAPR